MDDFLALLLAGKYLPAIGLFLIAFVGVARAGFGSHWPWFKTKIGGYVLGYGSAVLLYIGGSWSAGAGVSIALLLNAIAAGWAASGGWEMARDMIEAFRRKGDPGEGEEVAKLPRASVVSLGAVVAIVVALTAVGCGHSSTAGKIADRIDPIVWDCTILDKSKLEIAGIAIGKLASASDWIGAAGEAANFGAMLGGCKLAEYVQEKLSRRGVNMAEAWSASDAMQRFRDELAPGVVFHTEAGDL
jgi:hypothetical protein